MRTTIAAAVGTLAVMLLSPGGGAIAAGGAKGKPSLSLRVSSQVAFVPARVTVTADLRNVTDDNGDLYCPDVEWEWGDDTRSTTAANCEPFEPGVSKVKIRYVQQHTYNTAGRYKIYLRLRKDSRTVLAGSTDVTVRGGPDDDDRIGQ